MEQVLVIQMDSVIGLSENIRTRTGAKLLRKISLQTIHFKLMELFVDRFKLEQEILDNIKPEIDVGYLLSRDYLIQEYCYCEHSVPQMQGYHERIHGFDKSDLIFIEDGGNNEC